MKSKKQRIIVFVLLVELIALAVVSIVLIVQNVPIVDTKYEHYGEFAGFFNNSEIEGFIAEYKTKKLEELEMKDEQNNVVFSFSELYNKSDICIIKIKVYKMIEKEYKNDAILLDSDNVWITKTGEKYKLTIEK